MTNLDRLFQLTCNIPTADWMRDGVSGFMVSLNGISFRLKAEYLTVCYKDKNINLYNGVYDIPSLYNKVLNYHDNITAGEILNKIAG